MSLLFIEWNADPTIITLLGFPIRWYGLCFALAFLAGFQVVSYIFKKEGRPVEQADQLLIYTMVGTVAGARMGHYFFYEFPLLLADPVRFFIQMITPPFSGLASHGAAIGLFTAYYLYTKKNKDQSYLYVTDRIVIATALAGFFIYLIILYSATASSLGAGVATSTMGLSTSSTKAIGALSPSRKPHFNILK